MPKKLRKSTEPRQEPTKVCDSNGILLLRCCVCLNNIEQVSERGVLNCGHEQFCFTCIIE